MTYCMDYFHMEMAQKGTRNNKKLVFIKPYQPFFDSELYSKQVTALSMSQIQYNCILVQETNYLYFSGRNEKPGIARLNKSFTAPVTRPFKFMEMALNFSTKKYNTLTSFITLLILLPLYQISCVYLELSAELFLL